MTSKMRGKGNDAQSFIGASVIRQSPRTALLVATIAAVISVIWIAAIWLAGGLTHLNPGILLIPIVIAGFYFGPIVGIGTAIVIGLAIGPWTPSGMGIPQPMSDWVIRLLSYAAVGGVVGFLSLQQHRRSRQTIERQRTLLESTPDIIERERIKALQQMSRGVVHDFNNALAPILGFSEMLADPEFATEQEKIKRYAQAIKTAGTNAAAVVNRLREFYQQEGANAALMPVDLSLVVEQSLAMTEARWRSQARADNAEIEATVECPSGLTVMGNDAELRGVLTNLIFNAVDAMPQGGTLTFKASQGETGITLTVSDTGAGMSPEHLRKCTEAYFTTKETGTGLGMSLVNSIMKYHGGKLEITSRQGAGTQVTLHFPIPTPAKMESANSDPVAPQTPSLRILVAEDDLLVREMLEEVLRTDGHQVRSASEGTEAVSLFQSHTDRFDLVICDAAMPRLSGSEVAAGIRRIRPETPFILLSGFDAPTTKTELEKKPFTVVLTKPVSLHEIRKALWQVSNGS